MNATRAARIEAEALAERIAGTIPVTQLAFLKLLGLLDIELTREVPSAAVSVGARSRLLLNPDFLDRHCRTDAALMMLVLHELNHILLGHTRAYPRVTPAHNLVFDALINAQLCRALPDPCHTALFRGLYRADRFPEALLRPPPGWGTPDEEWQLEGAALEVHRALYRGDDVTQRELFELLAGAVTEEVAAGLCPSRLLGNHGGAAVDEGADPALLDVVRELVARWPALERCSGRDVGHDRERTRRDPRQARRQAVAAIRRALASVAAFGAGTRQAVGDASRALDTVLPFRTTVDRRAEVRTSFGAPPLQYRAVLPVRSPSPRERAHVYLDVSGSMHDVIPLLYGALLPLADHLHPQVHLFSTELHDISLAQLRRGVVVSDGGTDIDCVTAHMVENGVRRAAIFTDGMVGLVPPHHLAVLRKRRVRVAVVLTDARSPQLALTLGGRAHVLPSLS